MSSKPGSPGNAFEPVEAAGHRIPVLAIWKASKRERERDHREIGAALAASAETRAMPISEASSAGSDGGERQDQNGDDRAV